MRGAGGYGKTTLARALARDPDIQDAYFDGILWAELGEKPERLIATLSDLVTLLSGERPQLETINAAAAKLGETLGDRRILMVIDDVWREQDLQPFLQGGRNCVRLVTTRIDSVLPPQAVRQKVDAMQADEALRQISFGLPQDHATRERASLASLAARLGEWPLLLKIVNGFLRNRVGANEPLPVAIAGANKRLDAKGLTAFDRARRDGTRQGRRRARSASASTFCRRRNGSVSASWASSRRMPTFRSGSSPAYGPRQAASRISRPDDLLAKLFDLSLLLERDLGQGFFRLHDTVRQFLRDQAGKERLIAQHKALIAVSRRRRRGGGRADSPLLLPQSSASPCRGGRAGKAGRAAARPCLAQGEA